MDNETFDTSLKFFLWIIYNYNINIVGTIISPFTLKTTRTIDYTVILYVALGHGLVVIHSSKSLLTNQLEIPRQSSINAGPTYSPLSRNSNEISWLIWTPWTVRVWDRRCRAKAVLMLANLSIIEPTFKRYFMVNMDSLDRTSWNRRCRTKAVSTLGQPVQH